MAKQSKDRGNVFTNYNFLKVLDIFPKVLSRDEKMARVEQLRHQRPQKMKRGRRVIISLASVEDVPGEGAASPFPFFFSAYSH
jgi:hypothetical protein